jgi:hypothetical protein
VAAYNSNDKDDIEKWILLENHSLPFLLQVLKDHKSYFSSIKTGLNEVEYLGLSLINEGVCLFYDLFNSIMEKRINDGLSNLHFAAILKELMNGPFPLLIRDIPLLNYLQPASNSKLELTFYGWCAKLYFTAFGNEWVIRNWAIIKDVKASK